MTPITSPETSLIYVIYVVYLFDCLCWLELGQEIFIRVGAMKWKPKFVESQSYTLLKRMPVLVNLLPFIGGAVILSKESSEKLSNYPTCKQKKFFLRLERTLVKTQDLIILGSLLGFVSLFLVPAAIYFGCFPSLWMPILLSLLGLHFSVLVEFFGCTKEWRHNSPVDFYQNVLALTVNPLQGIRSASRVLNWAASAALSHEGR